MVINGWLVFFAISFGANAGAAEAPPQSLFIVHFETGPSWNESLALNDQPGFREHSANLSRLRSEGIIVFGARYDDLGIVFLDVEALDEAKSLMEADPGVRSGIFSYRAAPLRVFYPWQE